MLYLPQITHELAVDRTQISGARGRRLTALSVLRPAFVFICENVILVIWILHQTWKQHLPQIYYLVTILCAVC